MALKVITFKALKLHSKVKHGIYCQANSPNVKWKCGRR